MGTAESQRSPVPDSDSLSSDWELRKAERGLKQPMRSIALAKKLNWVCQVNPLGLKDLSNR